MLLNFLRSNRLWILLILATLALSLGARFYIKQSLSGDEPHYLVMANSLKIDHDLNLKNDYEERRYYSYHNSELEPHINWAIVDRSSDRWYSIHSPGLPLLILPSVLFSQKLGPILIMIGFGLLAVIGGVVLSRLVAKRNAAFLAGIMFALSVPFVALAGRIFPDIVIGALLAITFALIGIRLKSIWREIVIGLLAAVLIWVHVKTSLIAGSLILIEALTIVRSSVNKMDRNRSLVALLVPFVILSGLLQFKFYQWFGVLTPNGIYEGTNKLFQLSPLKALLAIIFDPFKGFLVSSPIWFSVVVGFPEWYRRNKKQLLLVLFLIIPSLLIQSTFSDWAGGWSSPARYMMQYLPILLPALALGLEVMFRSAKMRPIALFLIAMQVIISAAYILFRTPWASAGRAFPFIVILENKLHLSGIPAVFFDKGATPNLAGILVIAASVAIGILLLVLHHFQVKENLRAGKLG